MKGGPVPGSVRCTGGAAEWVLVVSVAKVSRRRGMSGESLCSGSEILELVRASHSWSSFEDIDGAEDCGAPLVASRISVSVERQAQHRPHRLKKPRTGSVRPSA